MMKGAKLRENPRPGYSRTFLEPVKSKGISPSYEYCTYLRKVEGHVGYCMCYCNIRWDWLIRTLAKLEVNVQQLMPPSTQITREKCQEIHDALVRLKESRNERIDYELLKDDINFFGKCEGVIINDWVAHSILL